MGFNIVDAYENVKALTQELEVEKAKVGFLYKCVEKIDAIIVDSGKASVIKATQKEVNEDKEEEDEQEEPEEEVKEQLDELEEDGKKKKKKSKRIPL